MELFVSIRTLKDSREFENFTLRHSAPNAIPEHTDPRSTEIDVMLTSNPGTPSATPTAAHLNAQWSFASPFETPPAAHHVPSIFYTNQTIAQAAQHRSDQVTLARAQQVLQFASEATGNIAPQSFLPVWFSPQPSLTVRPMLMPFRSPQTDMTKRGNLNTSDIIDAHILQKRYGANIASLARRSAGLTYSAAVSQAADRRPAHGLHYHEINIPLFTLVNFRDGQARSLALYQPRPAGVRELLRNTRGRDGWPVRVQVAEAVRSKGQAIDARLNEFLASVDWWEIFPSSPRIVILMDEQRHAIPVILATCNGGRFDTPEGRNARSKRLVIILDSTAGSSVGMYRKLASQHPDLDVWLNEGSRQVDAYSCITDAIEVACQASDDPTVVAQVRTREISADERVHLPNSRLRLKRSQADAQDSQLHRFNLPESLAISAQSRSFLNNPAIRQDHPIMVNADATTLRHHLQASQDVARRQYFNSDSSANQLFTALNCYLYTASERHARVLDALAAA